MVRRNEEQQEIGSPPAATTLDSLREFVVNLTTPQLSFPGPIPAGCRSGGEATPIDDQISACLERCLGRELTQAPTEIVRSAVTATVSLAEALEPCDSTKAYVGTFEEPHGFYTLALIEIVYSFGGEKRHRTWAMMGDPRYWIGAFGPNGETIGDRSGDWIKRSHGTAGRTDGEPPG